MTIEDNDDFDDYMAWNYNDEINDTLHLVLKGYLPPNIFCMPLMLTNFKNRFECRETPNISMTISYDLNLDPIPTNTNKIIHWDINPYDLKETFDCLENVYAQVYPKGSVFDEKEIFNNTRNAIKLFTESLLSGFIPPKESMLAIAYAFELYMEAAGDLSLESVFFGEPKKGAGNYSKNTAKTYDRFATFHYYVVREKNNFKTLEELALRLLKNNSSDEEMEVSPFRGFNENNIDSFLRGYRRWKQDNE